MSAPSPHFQRAGPAAVAGPWQEARLRSVAEMGRVIDDLLADMRGRGYREGDLFGMHLALEEVIVNAIRHGNGGDPSKEVRVRWNVGPERTLVEIEDEGPGFRPDLVPDPTAPENLERPGGRGLLLIRCYTNWVQYNDRGNCVTLCKHASTPASSSKPA
jgi:serine/threonine-protein kinase RsbW